MTGADCACARERSATVGTHRPPTSDPRCATIRHLKELVAALDRRMPQVMRAGESAIARDAAALRVSALQRVDELEAFAPSGETAPRPSAVPQTPVVVRPAR